MLETLGQNIEGLRCLPLVGGKQVPVDGGCVSEGVHVINCTPDWSRDLLEHGFIGVRAFRPPRKLVLGPAT